MGFNSCGNWQLMVLYMMVIYTPSTDLYHCRGLLMLRERMMVMGDGNEKSNTAQPSITCQHQTPKICFSGKFVKFVIEVDNDVFESHYKTLTFKVIKIFPKWLIHYRWRHFQPFRGFSHFSLPLMSRPNCLKIIKITCEKNYLCPEGIRRR